MFVSTSTAILHPNAVSDPAFSLNEIPYLLKEAGFEKADWSLWDFCLKDNKIFTGLLTEDDWEKQILQLQSAAERNDLSCGQTHCVSVNWNIHQALDHSTLRMLEERCLISAGILGAESMVIHPFAKPGSAEDEAIGFFSDYLKPLIDLAGRCGVKIAVENMIQADGQPHRFCSDASELAALIDSISDPFVCACWDTGHGNLSRKNQYDQIMILGSRLTALHIDDNLGGSADLHLLPYEGLIDWNDVLKALAKIRYDHDFTFEHALNHTPKEVMASQLEYMSDLGHHMVRRIEELKN